MNFPLQKRIFKNLFEKILKNENVLIIKNNNKRMNLHMIIYYSQRRLLILIWFVRKFTKWFLNFLDFILFI